jgi:thymidine phosphorylase
VGLELHVKVGDFVTVGQPLATIHAQSSEQLEYAKEWLLMAIQVQNAPVLPLPIVVRPA